MKETKLVQSIKLVQITNKIFVDPAEVVSVERTFNNVLLIHMKNISTPITCYTSEEPKEIASRINICFAPIQVDGGAELLE